MTEVEQNRDLVDRYLRNELMPDEETEFETAMLESPDLQLQLETSMAIRQAVLLENEPGEMSDKGGTQNTQSLPGLGGRNNWQPLALAASVVLAVFSTIMYWKVGNEAGMLQAEIEALKQPHTEVLIVPLYIMRSASNQTPDVIIQKPDGNALLVLDVELTPAVVALGQVRMTLRDKEAVEILSWDSANFDDGRVISALDTRNLPVGQVWLEMSDQQGQVIDRRLLEFLP